DKKKYHILFISGVENVEIVNPHIEGDRKEVEMNHGEWGMGISIISSKNVSITNCNIYNCRGDGIYISRDEKLNIIPVNVSIKGCLLHNNRRNGVSIIRSIDLTIRDLSINNINGALTMAGIDIEPSTNKDK